MRRSEGEAKYGHKACAVQGHTRLRGSLGMLGEDRGPAHAYKGRRPQPTGGGKKGEKSPQSYVRKGRVLRSGRSLRQGPTSS